MSTELLLNLPGGGKIPIVGFGALIYPKSPEDKVNVEEVVDNALKNGYRHIDTAYFYKTEQQIGNVLKRWISDGKLKREDLFITTKLPFSGTHPDRVEKFIKESLKDLQLDYVDLYLIHYPIGLKHQPEKQNVLEMDFEPVNDHVAIWKQMEAQVDAGRAKAIGLSNFNIPQIKKILAAARIKPASLQVYINVYHQQKELVKFCKQNGIVVVAYSPLGKHRQPDEPISEYTPKDQPQVMDDPVVNELAKKYSKTASQILLRFIVQKGIVVIPKSSSPERQKENLNIFDFTLSDGDVKKLEALDRQGTDKQHYAFVLPENWRNHPDYPNGI